ncbi:MAG: hypothetical protein ACM33T_10330 [Solirubrobacterales bacterium]
MKLSSLTKALAVSAIALMGALTAGQAEAFSGAWGSQTGGPTIYQTNWAYYSSDINAPAGIPTTAIVTSMPYSAGLSYYPTGLNVGVCPSDAGGGCYWTTSASGTIYPSDNRKAAQSFRFGFYVAQSTTHILNPYVYGGVDNLVVNYTY